MKPPNAQMIIEASMELRAHHPAGWEKLVKALEDYAGQVLGLTLTTDPTLVMRAQGMAIQAAEIATILRTSPEVYDAMRQQQARAQHAKRHSQPAGQPQFRV